jgi:hypothetical protein
MYKGGLIDNRKEKKDYSHLEVGFASEVKYLTKERAEKKSKEYKARNQKSTSSCGGHAGELMASILYGDIYEPAFLYRLRRNYPSEGMFHYDIGDILIKNGICKDRGIEKTEGAYNLYRPSSEDYTEARDISGGAYIVLEDNKFGIDDIARISNILKKPIVLFVYWKGTEWSSALPIAKGELSLVDSQYRHFVTVLPESAYEKRGKKYVIIQDSSHFGKTHIRHLSEDWIMKRVYTGLYLTELRSFKTPYKLEKYIFTKDLQFGDSGEEVKHLQSVLQDLGFFPLNIEPTGYFGGITRQAVKDFQKKYEKSILWVVGLKKPTGYFGISTRKKLNSLTS